MVHIYYRASTDNGGQFRPSFFSKLSSLKNFIFCLKKISEYKFTLIFDGIISREFAELVSNIGAIKTLPKVGNAESFWRTYQMAIKLHSNEIVYFVEDDYLHTPDAIEKLVECRKELKIADYVTLYDHPVRYAADYRFGLDMPLKREGVYLTKQHHWRTVESTCMTFCANVETLKADKIIFERYVKNKLVPEDRELFRRLQGLNGYETDSYFRTVVGPVPSLATHCHAQWMAPLINWVEIAKETTDW